MSCPTIDLKAYWLGEMEARERTLVEDHTRGCAGCRAELERLDLTKAALFAIPDEEVPRRIAFVSDAVFEPRWWQRVWNSGPVMGFASAVVLAAAILAHGAIRPAAPITGPTQVASGQTVSAKLSPAAFDPQMQKQVDERVHLAVAQAVAQAVTQVEQRQTVLTAKLLDAAEKRFDSQRRYDLVTAQETIRMYQQQAGRMMVAYNNTQAGTQP